MSRQVLSRSGVFLREIFDDFKQLLSPPLCIGCDGILAENDPVFCESCLETLRSTCPGFGPVCPFCGSADFNNESCRHCNESSRIRLYYWGRYRDKMIEYIAKFKFQGVLELGIRLADEAAGALGELLRRNGYDYVVPVPLHKSRRRRREYNQSEIIARKLSKELGVEFIPDSVFRIRSTKQQAKITNEPQRWINVKDAFGLSDVRKVNFENKKVLIVDDIVTTGATVYELSRPIFGHSPQFVDVFSLAYAG